MPQHDPLYPLRDNEDHSACVAIWKIASGSPAAATMLVEQTVESGVSDLKDADTPLGWCIAVFEREYDNPKHGCLLGRSRALLCQGIVRVACAIPVADLFFQYLAYVVRLPVARLVEVLQAAGVSDSSNVHGRALWELLCGGSTTNQQLQSGSSHNLHVFIAVTEALSMLEAAGATCGAALAHTNAGDKALRTLGSKSRAPLPESASPGGRRDRRCPAPGRCARVGPGGCGNRRLRARRGGVGAVCSQRQGAGRVRLGVFVL